MVDREARNKIARIVQDFTAGRITTRELDGGLPYSRSDHTAAHIANVLAENYEMSRECYINQKGPISREGRRSLARIAMFLRTDLEYPKPSRIAQTAACLLMLPLLPLLILTGLISAAHDCAIRWFQRTPAPSKLADQLWPFTGLEEYQDALKHPKLLCGKS